jgi:hypothetical protein
VGLAGAKWVGRCVEENIARENEQAFVRTRGENGKTYVSRRCSNNHGRYIEITESGRGGRRGRVVIPEGRRMSGWRGFGKELQLLFPEQQHSPGVSRHTREVVVGEKQPMQGVEEVAGIHGQKTYAGVVGRGAQAKCNKEKAPKMVVVPPQPAPAASRGFISGKKLDIQNIPQNQAHARIRLPLRFFPNQNISSDNGKLGTRLIISLNEGEKRLVSRRLKEVDQPLDQTCATWVPRVNIKPTFTNGPSTQVGSSYQPHFEKGESSGLSRVGSGCMDVGPKNVEHLHSRPAELNLVEMGSPLTLEHLGSHEEIVAGTGDVRKTQSGSSS